MDQDKCQFCSVFMPTARMYTDGKKFGHKRCVIDNRQNNNRRVEMINTLKDVKEINGKPICVMDDLREKYPEKFNESGAMDYKWFESEIRPNFNIFLRHDVDSLSFSMLTKPASEGGDLNRCQLVDLITTGLVMLKYLNNKFPCRENAITITKLEEALMWQKKRTEDRETRGVEGTNQK